MAEHKQFTEDETRLVINTKAKADGDNFWIKIFRNRGPMTIPENVATVSDAQAIHLFHPERWLPRLLGGGPIFHLQAFHANSPNEPLGGFIKVAVPTDSYPAKSSAEIDQGLLKRPDWQGPQSIQWPTPEDKRALQSQPPGWSVGSLSSPPAPTSGNVANQSAWRDGGSGATFPHHLMESEYNRIKAQQDRLESERALFESRRQEMEARSRQEELNAIRRENEARIRELEASMKLAAATTAAAQPQHRVPTLSEQLPSLIAALAPILQQMMQAQNEIRLALMKQQESAAAQQQNMLQLFLAKPTLDPAIEKAFDRMQSMVEKTKADPNASSQMLHNMVDTMSTMFQNQMDVLSMASDLGLGGGGGKDEPPVMKAIKQGIKGLNAMMEGFQQNAAKQALAGIPPPVDPLAAYRLAAAQQPAPLPQTVPQAQRVPPPAQQPQAAHAQQPQQPPPNGNGGQMPTIIEQLEGAIRAKVDPKELAGAFLKNIEDPSIQAAMEDADGVFEVAVAKRLGPWALDPANSGYLDVFKNEVFEQGARLGLWDEDEDDDDDEEDASLADE